MSRDLILEIQGISIIKIPVDKIDHDYVFVRSSPISFVDYQGLILWNTLQEPGVEFNDYKPILGEQFFVSTDNGEFVPVFRPFDRVSFFCHSYTFDGSTQPNGPFNFDGGVVRRVLEGDNWRPVCCGMAEDGIAVFISTQPLGLNHSGKINKVVITNGQFDEDASILNSKWGWLGLGATAKSFAENSAEYGQYECFVKDGLLTNPTTGCCPKKGNNERPMR